MQDVASRLNHRVQLTTDGHAPYLSAVKDSFGSDIACAMLPRLIETAIGCSVCRRFGVLPQAIAVPRNRNEVISAAA